MFVKLDEKPETSHAYWTATFTIEKYPNETVTLWMCIPSIYNVQEGYMKAMEYAGEFGGVIQSLFLE